MMIDASSATVVIVVVVVSGGGGFKIDVIKHIAIISLRRNSL